MRHVVQIERQSKATDEYGALVDVWNQVALKRASIEPINGREYFAQSGEHAEVTTRIRMRHDAVTGAMKPLDRVLHRGDVYDVISVISVQERNRETVLMCKRGYQ